MKTFIPLELSLPELMTRFSTEEAAIELLESIRWKSGIVCPHCNNSDQERFWKRTANKKTKVRVGLRQCALCRGQFRVTMGTIFEDSHIPLNLWLIAWYLMCGAKKGMSALQLQRHLGLGSYKSAWFMAHRIRHAMQDTAFTGKLSGVVESDETYVGGKIRSKKGDDARGKPGPTSNKVAVVSLVSRDGDKRSFVMERVTAHNIAQAVYEHVEDGSTLMTEADLRTLALGAITGVARCATAGASSATGRFT